MPKFLVIIGVLSLLLWPLVSQAQDESTTQSQATTAVITAVEAVDREGEAGFIYRARLLDGPDQRKTITIGDDESVTNVGFGSFAVGDRVLVSVIHHIDGSERYLILDYARTNNLWWLVVLFVLAIIWFSRWRGVRSIVGLGLSFVIIIGWIVPQIVQGANPILVTIAGGTVMLVIGFLLLEGWTKHSLAAGVGTVAAMILTGALSWWAVEFVHLTGQGTEEVFFLQGLTNGSIDIRGLLLAGIIIGALGILDDIAVSQVATVAELRRANPSMRPRQVYHAAMRVGRSHLGAIINTLVFAYAGASLPLLVLFSMSDQSTTSILNNEAIATEIVRTIVGSIGLVLALPLTTLAAVWLKVVSKEHRPQAGPLGPELEAEGRADTFSA